MFTSLHCEQVHVLLVLEMCINIVCPVQNNIITKVV